MSYPDYELHDSVDRTTTQASGSGPDRVASLNGPDDRHVLPPTSRDFSGYTSGPTWWPAV